MSQPLDDAVAEAILRYLRQHPHAADSAEGVARWWVPPALGASASVVKASLGALVRRGELRRVRLADGSVLYSHAGVPTPQ